MEFQIWVAVKKHGGILRTRVARGKNQEQQLQGPRKANQDKTESYCLDRRQVIPQAEFRDPFPDQNVKTPEHGLAAIVVDDPAVTTEVGRIAAAICGPEAALLDREQALIVAAAQVTLKRIRRVRAEIMDQMSPAPPTRQPDAPDTAPMPQVEGNARH